MALQVKLDPNTKINATISSIDSVGSIINPVNVNQLVNDAGRTLANVTTDVSNALMHNGETLGGIANDISSSLIDAQRHTVATLTASVANAVYATGDESLANIAQDISKALYDDNLPTNLHLKEVISELKQLNSNFSALQSDVEALKNFAKSFHQDKLNVPVFDRVLTLKEFGDTEDFQSQPTGAIIAGRVNGGGVFNAPVPNEQHQYGPALGTYSYNGTTNLDVQVMYFQDCPTVTYTPFTG